MIIVAEPYRECVLNGGELRDELGWLMLLGNGGILWRELEKYSQVTHLHLIVQQFTIHQSS